MTSLKRKRTSFLEINFYPHRGNRSFESDTITSEPDLKVLLLGLEKALASNNHLNMTEKYMPELPA